MEKDKRKRAGDGGETVVKRGKARQDGRAETGNDDEVEEFYAIIRRIHVAVKYFENGGRQLTTAPEKGSSLQSQDYSKSVDDGFKRRGVEDNKNVGLDLNADPEPDRESA